jgi:hypothetical protein
MGKFTKFELYSEEEVIILLLTKIVDRGYLMTFNNLKISNL